MDRLTAMEVFADVALRESFSATARELGLSPSGVSKLISRLETRLGVLLFKRNARQVVLTAEGRKYYDGVKHILESLAELEDSRIETSEISGHLRVMCSNSLAKHILAPRLAGFMDAYPALSLEFVQCRNDLLGSLDPGVDIAFYSAEPRSSSLIVRKILSTRHVICASPGYLSRWGEPSVPEDLERHRCLNLSTEAPCTSWSIRCSNGQMMRLQISAAVTADSSDLLLSLTKAGAGIARLARYHADEEIASGALAPILEKYNPQYDQPIYAVYHTRRYLSHRVRALLDYLSRNIPASERLQPSKSGADLCDSTQAACDGLSWAV